jgi:signal peptide peptidase SppA
MATMALSSSMPLARAAPRPSGVVARRAAPRRSAGAPMRLAVRVTAMGRATTRASAPRSAREPTPVPEAASRVPAAPKSARAPGSVSPAASRVAGVAALVALLAADPAVAAEFAPAAWAKSAAGGVAGFFSSPEAKELYMYTLKTLISWGVPAVVVAAAVFAVVASSRKGKDAKDANRGAGGPFSFLGGGAAAAPSPFAVKRLNDKLDSYAYAFEGATVSPESAERAKARRAFDDKYAATLGKLTAAEREAVTKAAEKWAREDASLRRKMAAAARRMRAQAVAKAGKKGGNAGGDADAEADAALEEAFPFLDLDEAEDLEERAAARARAGEADTLGADTSDTENPSSDSDASGGGFSFPGSSPSSALAKLAAKRADAEAKYVAAVAAALPAHKRGRLSKLLSDPRVSPGWEGNRDSLALPAERMARRDKKHVFVLNFFGDVQASQAAGLREEVTAVLRQAKTKRGDEVVLVLNTGGGTVTGYGLAAAQLTRLRDAGIKLTVCVEQVAASGGYMMACCADRLVASPFAVLGSIGVISEIPNLYERLKKEGIEFQTVTAGKFKRTLTPTKKIDPKDVEKSKADIEDVLVLFKTFVASQRPGLDIDAVATGETWFGADALKRGLCDELRTTDDVLLDMLKEGAEIFSVKYKPQRGGPAALLAGGGEDAGAFESVNAARGGGWNAIRALALGVAAFAGAAGGGAAGGADVAGLGLTGGLGAGPSGGALAMDAARAAEKVMARDGRYAAVDDDEMYF